MIFNVAEQFSDDGSSVILLDDEEQDSTLLDNFGTCVDLASTGLSVGLTVNKTVQESVKFCKKMSESPKLCVTHGLNLARLGAKLIDVKASALKIPTLGLKLSNCNSLADKLTCGAQLIGSTAALSSSVVDVPYLKQCGKVILTGTKLCKDVSCLLESKKSSDRWCYGIKAACDTASLISLFTPLSDSVDTATDWMSTGTKVYKAN
jgi:hypothetical protein